MAFGLFILLNAVLFIRPAELVPALENLPLYELIILLCAAASLPATIRMLTEEKLSRAPVLAGVLAMWVCIVLSHLTNFQTFEAREEAVSFFKVVLYYLLLVTNVNSKQRLNRFVFWLAVLTLAMTTLALLQYHEWVNLPALEAYKERQDDVLDPDTGEPVFLFRLVGAGIFNDPNDLCLILCLGAFFCLYLALEQPSVLKRLAWLVPVAMFGYALSLTHSRGGFLAMLAGLGVLFANRFGMKKALALGAVGLPLIFFVFAGRQTSISTSEGTGAHRIQLWSDGLAMLRGRALLFGIGKGQVVEELGWVLHNSYVQSYVELGLVGGTVFVGLFVYSARALLLARSAAVVADEGLRRLQPYLLAVVTSFFVGLLSLSRQYTLTTYILFGLVTAYLKVAKPAPAEAPAWMRVGRPLLSQLAVVSVLFLGALYVFVRLSVNWEAGE